MLEGELTSQEAADLIGVSRPFLVKHLAPSRMVGNRRRYQKSEVEAFNRRLTQLADKQWLTNDCQY